MSVVDTIKKSVLENFGGTITAGDMLFSLIVSFIIGICIVYVYRKTYTGVVYSKAFSLCILMLSMVTAMIIRTISSNISLSLGRVGALSIVRYRTAIKDPRDTAYIFWAIAAGICCGVQDFMVAGIGSGVIFIVMLVMGNVRNNDRYLVIVRGSSKCIDEAREVVDKYFDDKAKIRVENTTKDTAELIYEASEKVLASAKQKNGCMPADVLYKVEGIDSVNIVCQNDEINR